MEGICMDVVKYSGGKPETADRESSPQQPRILHSPLQPPPPPPPFHPGQWWFSNKIHTRLTPLQHALLSTRPTPIQPSPQPNKCRKLRPWLILSLLPNSKALVICSTTRENRGATGLTPAQALSFLPITPTPEFCGRAPVRVVLDERGVFVGKSLVFLEVVRVVGLGVLGEFIGGVGIEGEEAGEGLERVWEGRRECEFFPLLFFFLWVLLLLGGNRAEFFLSLFLGVGLGVKRNGGDVDREQSVGGSGRGRGRGKGRRRRSPRGRGSVSSENREWRLNSRGDATTFQASADCPGRLQTAE